jgi:hypothetical protein
MTIKARSERVALTTEQIANEGWGLVRLAASVPTRGGRLSIKRYRLGILIRGVRLIRAAGLIRRLGLDEKLTVEDTNEEVT